MIERRKNYPQLIDGVVKNGNDIITLREYVDLRFDNVITATDLARNSIELRLGSMNEFRSSLKDQAATFVTKAEYDTIATDVRGLRESRAELDGKASATAVNLSLLISIIGLLIAVFALVKIGV